MNCHPGDMALVKCGHPAENIGRIIRCVAIDDFASTICSTPMWLYEGDLVGTLGKRSAAIPDNCLRPIRDPGSDAVDEMVAKVGAAPKTLTEVREVSHG